MMMMMMMMLMMLMMMTIEIIICAEMHDVDGNACVVCNQNLLILLLSYAEKQQRYSSNSGSGRSSTCGLDDSQQMNACSTHCR